MNWTQKFAMLNPCYRVNRTIDVKGLMLHSVGCPQPDPNVFFKVWNNEEATVCVHGVIGTQEAIQLLPWNHRGWHAGGSANNTHIGIEMTEPSTIKYVGGSTFIDLDPEKSEQHVKLTYLNAVDLFAQLCVIYGLDPLTQIISHAQGYKLGVASNHGDPVHLWSRYPNLGYSMETFCDDVLDRIERNDEMPHSWAHDACEWAVELGLIRGKGNGVYGWQDSLTREELAVILQRFHKLLS